ncbi:MAG: hypothetical protein E7107_14130 [Prevotella sp.]|jgi:hypothetical protein|nr:hypothetical protein [Prevotella sp.]MCR5366455.1 hypothetical protein [Prevotella sp.]
MNNNDFELENMRQQMTTLKNKLNQQEIVSDRLMRRSMRNEVNTIARRYYIIMFVGLFMVPYGYWCFVKLGGLSIFFWIITSIFMLVCTGATFYTYRKISDPDMMNRNLVEARKRVASAKKFEANWLFIGIPAVVLWMSWFLYETYQLHGGALTNGLFWGGCIGGIIGAICGLSLNFKTQRQYQDIIDQIEDLTAEN